MSLLAKTTALLAAIVFTVLVTASLFWLHYQEDSLKHAIFHGVDGQARIAAHGIESFIDDGLKDAQAISVMVPGQDLLQNKLGEVQSRLRTMFEVFPKFQNGIFILDAKGKFVVDYPPHPELQGQSFAFREYYQRTIKENHGTISKPYRSKRTGLPVLTFTAPIRARGRIIAMLACSMDLVSQEALGGYRKQRFWNTGYLYIFDRSHLLVLHPQDDRLLTRIEPGKNDLVDSALTGFEGVGESVNSQGVPMLVAIRKIPNTGWFVAVQVTQKEAYAPVMEARTRFIVVSGIAILLVIALGAAVIRRVSLPLQQLEHAASQISTNLDDTETNGGGYEPSYTALDNLRIIRSRDEIGLLASSFLQLTIKLKHTLGSLRRSSEDWERTFDSVYEAVVTLDVDSRIVRMNQIAETWFRTSRKKARGRYGYQVILGAAETPLEWPDIASLGKSQRIRWTQGLETRSGIFEFVVTPIIHAEETTGAVLVISDVTARVESEKQIHEMAFYDPLTGLPNRFLLQDRIQHAIASANRNKTMAVIMFIDLDHFKEVNDFYGHDVGDDVLRQVAGRIAACLRKNDTLSRIGGDEFVVVLQDVSDPREVAAAAERIIELRAPLILHGHELIVTSSIGIAFFPEDGADSETLLKNADTAMYRAKDQGRNNYQYFTQDLVC